MGSLSPATMAGSGARSSATTWRANERMEEQKVDGKGKTVLYGGGMGEGVRGARKNEIPLCSCI